MKQLFLSALIAGSVLSAGAKSYVFSSGNIAENEDVTVSVTPSSWESGWGEYADADAPTGKKLVLTTNSEWGGYAALLWEIPSVDDALTSILSTDATLEFYVKSSDNCNISVAFTKVVEGENQNITQSANAAFSADGTWNKVSLPIHDYFHDVVDAISDGDKVQLPFFTVTGQPNYSQTEFADIRIVEGGELKDPHHGAINYGTDERILNYGGKDYVVHVDYILKANNDNTLTATVDCRGFENIAGLVRRIHFAGQDYTDLVLQDGKYTATSTAKYELGQTLNDFFILLPYAGADMRVDINNYIYGRPGTEPAKSINSYLLNAAINRDSDTSATITYDLFRADAAPAGDYTLYINGEDKGVANGTYEITGLTAADEPTYKIYAELKAEDFTYRTPEAILTLEAPKAFHLAMDGVISNAYLHGEEESQRRDIPLSLEFTVTYEPNHTLTFDMEIHGGAVVGMVPNLKVSYFDNIRMTEKDATHFTANSGANNVTYTLGQLIEWFQVTLAYNGGSVGEGVFVFQAGGGDKGAASYHAGDENDPDIYGDAVEIALDMPKTVFHAGESIVLNPYGKDANGHYVFGTETFEFDVEGEAFSIEGNVLTAVTRSDGEVTLTVSSGDTKVEKQIRCVSSPEAVNLFTAEKVVNYNISWCNDHNHSNFNTDALFDNDPNTGIVWNCDNNDAEHYLEIDLGANHNIEAIEINWDGACATKYKIHFIPGVIGGLDAKRRADAQTVIIEENNDNNGDDQGFGNSYKGSHTFVTPGTGATAQKIRIETSEANNTSWGMKIMELSATGTVLSNESTSVVDVAIGNEEGEAVYYNLQGVHVENPTPGIYVRHIGNKVEKVIVR